MSKTPWDRMQQEDEKNDRRQQDMADVPPELPNPVDAPPKRLPPPVAVFELPKPGLVVEPKPVPTREDSSKRRFVLLPECSSAAAAERSGCKRERSSFFQHLKRGDLPEVVFWVDPNPPKPVFWVLVWPKPPNPPKPDMATSVWKGYEADLKC